MTDHPNPFSPTAITGETATFNAWLEAELAILPPVHTVPPALTRDARAEGRGVFPIAGPRDDSDWVNIQGSAGWPGRVRMSLPGDGVPPRGTYLHIHGGGWTLGVPDQYDAHNQRIARATGCRVAAPQYRLAPEHPWPACADDCEAAALWALEEFDGPLLIGGESAGAHLTAVTLVRLKARGLAGRVAGVVLNYGIFDLRMTPSMANWGPRNLILSTPTTLWFVNNLLPEGSDTDPADPAVSPLMADLTGLGPALFQVGTNDPLLDDSLFLSQRWQAAGNRVDLAIYPGGVHAFDMFDLAIADASRARQDRFVSGCIGACLGG
jgi:acetyl esterase/lipase